MSITPPSDELKALVAAASPETQALWGKQEDFSITEVIFLAIWLEGVLRGEPALALRVLSDGARAEHWRSLLAARIADIPDDQLAILTQATKDFDKTLQEFRDRARPDTDPREQHWPMVHHSNSAEHP